MGIAEHEVDGVPVLHAAGRDPERCSAFLLFRAGSADERLATHGLTHLVEHLALRPVHRTLYRHNGFVEPLLTGFNARGTVDEVAGFLEVVCRSLSDLPLDALEDEIGVLRVEERDHVGAGTRERIMRSWFGARGHGLLGFNPVGLGVAGPDRVRAWCAERFTAGNAVLWCDSDELPGRLRLPLEPGSFRPPPAAESLPRLALPGRLDWPEDAVALTGRARMSLALDVGLTVLSERLLEELRRRRGLVYDVQPVLHSLGRGDVVAGLSVESAPEESEEIRDAILAAVAALVADGPAAEELARPVRWRMDAMREERGDPRDDLYELAEARLTGDPASTIAELERDLPALTPDAIRAALAAAFEHPLLCERAAAARGLPDGFAEVELTRTDVPDGRTFAVHADADFGDGTLVVGEAAIGWRDEDGKPVGAIDDDEVVVVDDHPLTGLRVTNPDDYGITVCATDLQDGDAVVAELRERYREHLVPVVDAATVAGFRAVAMRRLERTEVAMRACLAIADALSPGERVLELARFEDEAGPALIAVTDRGYVASSQPPERHDPVRGERERIASVSVDDGTLVLEEDGAKAWRLKIVPGDVSAEDLAELLR